MQMDCITYSITKHCFVKNKSKVSWHEGQVSLTQKLVHTH